ncbi:LysR family transcriptional regulator [Paenisporosarcina cavernae]|uniref:LysR family transcriptional regulator n=1 Tax=Paenisporosarcina cavernae TaxID=2320858 RepID=A0A385YVR8_9BACL|nr:LysR family transcriptional regulator [Paenisporosarcina cavernae]AYC30571.1 LysR family transcriptional regulator [Paenisporosarcina cavernae]
MEKQWIETFHHAAKTLNFRETAEKLYISQPAVSVHIKLLEKELGVALFHRANRSVSLTDAGRLFQEEATRILQQIELSTNRLHAFKQGYLHKRTIVISPLLAETIFPIVLQRFLSAHPDVDVTIRVEESRHIEQLVDTGEAHLGIGALPSIRKSVQTRLLYQEPVLLVGPADSLGIDGDAFHSHIDLLEHQTLLVHHHPVFWKPLLHRLHSTYPYIKTMKVTQSAIAKRFIQEGIGISFFPHSIVRRELLEGRLMEIPCPHIELPTVETYLLTTKKDELIEELVDKLQSYYYG